MKQRYNYLQCCNFKVADRLLGEIIDSLWEVA